MMTLMTRVLALLILRVYMLTDELGDALFTQDNPGGVTHA